jgi:hypothetical protein
LQSQLSIATWQKGAQLKQNHQIMCPQVGKKEGTPQKKRFNAPTLAGLS